jgi:hypothetical protein
MSRPNRPWIAAAAASTALGLAACSSAPRAPERVLLEPVAGPRFEPRAFDPMVLPTVSRAALAAPAYAGGALGTTHALLGGQEFEDTDFWDPIESNYSIAFDSSYENLDDWVGFEWGGGVYFNDGDRASDGPVTPGVLDYRLDSDLEMYEASLGVRRTFLRRTSFRPYVGLGATMTYYEAERIETGAPVPPDTVDYRQQIEHKRVTFGIYAHAGFEVQLGENWMLGLDARALRGTDLPEMFGHGDLDYDRVSFFVGFGG